MIWCTYIGKTFCQVWTDHKLVNTTQKLQFGVMVTEKSFWDKKLPLFVESPIYLIDFVDFTDILDKSCHLNCLHQIIV